MAVRPPRQRRVASLRAVRCYATLEGVRVPSRFRFRPPLDHTGSRSGKPIKYRARNLIKQRAHAHQPNGSVQLGHNQTDGPTKCPISGSQRNSGYFQPCARRVQSSSATPMPEERHAVPASPLAEGHRAKHNVPRGQLTASKRRSGTPIKAKATRFSVRSWHDPVRTTGLTRPMTTRFPKATSKP